MGLDTAVVLVGGKGTRLAPLTEHVPKSLIPFHGRPLLTHLLDLFRRYHIQQTYLCVGHMKEKVKAACGTGLAFGMPLAYIEEDTPLGTAGPLRLGAMHLTETFLCSNGDELKDIDIDAMYTVHRASGAKVTIALRTVDDPSQYGVAHLDGERILEFVEKPPKGSAPSDLINAGLYIIEPDVIPMIGDGFCMLEKDIFPKLAKEGTLVGFPFSGAWFDTGTSKRYAAAISGWTPLDSADQPYHSMDKSIFKAYDVRGVFPTEINPDVVHAIARAFVAHLDAKNVLIGRDARSSSVLLFDAIESAVRSQGADVVSVGECSTPFFYHAMRRQGSDAGIMITASHNPKQFNGLKLCKKGGVPLSGEDGLDAIQDIIARGAFTPYPSVKGSLQEINLAEEYIDYLKAHADRLGSFAGLRVVVDYGNGMAAKVVPRLLESLGIDATHLYGSVDCTFPNHEANPLKEETLRDLRRAVIGRGADAGIAFDGDGDRVGFVDEKGGVVSGDTLTAIIAGALLGEHPGEKILYDVRSSLDVDDHIVRCKGVPIQTRAGHSLIKKRMAEEDALFAGEKSGHYFFRSIGFVDNAELAALHVLSLLKDGRRLSGIVARIKHRFSSPEMNFSVDNKEAVLRRIEERYAPTAKEIRRIDGITFLYGEWWFNVRKSNTENLLRLNVEADSKELLQKEVDGLSRMLTEGL